MYQELIDKHQCIDGIRLGIDKVVIGIPSPPKIKLAGEITDQILIEEKIKKAAFKKDEYISNLHHIEYVIKNITNHTVQIISKNSKCYTIHPDNDYYKKQRLCSITVGWNYGRYFLNIAFNPSSLTQEDWHELSGLFSIMFNYNYEEIYMKGVVSRLEFYIDVLNINIAHSAYRIG